MHSIEAGERTSGPLRLGGSVLSDHTKLRGAFAPCTFDRCNGQSQAQRLKQSIQGRLSRVVTTINRPKEIGTGNSRPTGEFRNPNRAYHLAESNLKRQPLFDSGQHKRARKRGVLKIARQTLVPVFTPSRHRRLPPERTSNTAAPFRYLAFATPCHRQEATTPACCPSCRSRAGSQVRTGVGLRSRPDRNRREAVPIGGSCRSPAAGQTCGSTRPSASSVASSSSAISVSVKLRMRSRRQDLGTARIWKASATDLLTAPMDQSQ